MITKNAKGEYALYDQGKLIGFAPVKYIGKIRVIESMHARIVDMQTDALQSGVKLKLAAGLRSWDEQMHLRIQNVKDKQKQNDLNYLAIASPDQFNPRTGKPGWSNHQDGKAYDFNVTGFPIVYAWLVKNALAHGFVRTVLSERWHWEYISGATQFAYVPENDATWDGLV
jgi:LAS superfamily LD-carboxypeptidase LdcB